MVVATSGVRMAAKRWVKPGQADTRYQRSGQRWIDSLRVFCQGGHGGNGLPGYGGRGGDGGNVVVQASSAKRGKNKEKGGETDVESLYQLFHKTFEGDPRKQKVKANRGADASKFKVVGTHGEDKVLKVPKGVTICDEADRPLAQLDQYGDQFTVALGGVGGHKRTGDLGTAGQKRYIRIDYKLIADLGLVGFPNAGKSTLLKAISRANPKIASYPFTTVKPNLGELVFDDGRAIKMADLPGLIEGAHANMGMGHKFLKHVERTSVLVFVVDVNGFRLNPESPSRTAYQTVALLNRELELYNPDLLRKPAVCLINKMDSEGARDTFEELQQRLVQFSRLEPEAEAAGLEDLDESQRPESRLDFVDVIPMSAKFSPKSVLTVKERLRSVLDQVREAEATSSLMLGADEADTKLDLMLSDSSPKLT